MGRRANGTQPIALPFFIPARIDKPVKDPIDSEGIPFDTYTNVGSTAYKPFPLRRYRPFDSSSSQPIHVRADHDFLLLIVFWPDGLYLFSRRKGSEEHWGRKGIRRSNVRTIRSPAFPSQ